MIFPHIVWRLKNLYIAAPHRPAHLMDFKEKKKISRSGAIFSRAAFFIPENLSKKQIQTGFQPEEKVDIYIQQVSSCRAK